jgi:putative sterol carrier protein
MILLADEHSDLDEPLLNAVVGKVRAGTLAEPDITDCLRLFCMACNRVDELRFELSGFAGSYQLDLDGRRFALAFKGGACAAYSGDIESPDITLWVGLEVARGLVMGDINSGAAHMNGDIKYKGTKNGAVKLQSVFELFLDELEA